MRTQPGRPASLHLQPSRPLAWHSRPRAAPRSAIMRLRSQLLEDGLSLLRFTAADQQALDQYHGDARAGSAWLSRLALRGAVPALLLARAHAVPPELKLAPAPAGTRDLFLEGCVLRIVAGSHALVDILKPRRTA